MTIERNYIKCRRSDDARELQGFCTILAKEISQMLNFDGIPVVELKAWKERNSLQDWQNKLQIIRAIDYENEEVSLGFSYDGERGQIPGFDLPYGVPRWVGTSGDRASRPLDKTDSELSPDYYKIYLNRWVYRLKPAPLSPEEQEALEQTP